MYAKLKDNQIEFAPMNKVIETGIIFNYGEDTKLLKKDGYLPYQEDEMPNLTDGQTLNIEYGQSKSGITKKYKIIEKQQEV